MAKRRWRMARAVRDGASIDEVCARFHANVVYVQQACRVHSVDYPRNWSNYSVVAALQNTLDSCGQIGRDHGISRQAVHSVLSCAKAKGVKFPGRSDEGEEDDPIGR